mmetsp:Transcript_13471/g.25503  ORF Transcript_13471/g.25503 Transcript_13471/m.25503 type:complete len:220 (+) Transcript_13471:2524-3183(+)
MHHHANEEAFASTLYLAHCIGLAGNLQRLLSLSSAPASLSSRMPASGHPLNVDRSGGTLLLPLLAVLGEKRPGRPGVDCALDVGPSGVLPMELRQFPSAAPSVSCSLHFSDSGYAGCLRGRCRGRRSCCRLGGRSDALLVGAVRALNLHGCSPTTLGLQTLCLSGCLGGLSCAVDLCHGLLGHCDVVLASLRSQPCYRSGPVTLCTEILLDLQGRFFGA